MDVCPVRFVGPDVRDLVDSLQVAGQTVSLSEQEIMTPVQLDAVLVALPMMAEAMAPKRGKGGR
jgi:hypothetical protein